jgi:hypothetical protein
MAPWEPELSRSGLDDPVTRDSSPAPASAREALWVLRRDQTETDRRLATHLIKSIGMGDQVRGVKTESIRALTENWALVPAKSIRSALTATTREVLCLTNGATVGCSEASRVLRIRFAPPRLAG